MNLMIRLPEEFRPSHAGFSIVSIELLAMIMLESCCGIARTRSPHSGLSMEELKNAEFPSEWTAVGTARLKNGTYSERIAEGSISEILIMITDKIAYGKLREGIEAAAVVLKTQTGGSGVFNHLAVLIDRQGSPVTIGSTFLGDRVKVQDISIENGKIVLHVITHGPADPMCCPTLEVTQNYRLKGGILVQMPVDD